MSKRSKQKERKERRREEFESGDSHKHVYLEHPNNPGKRIVKTKEDHSGKIDALTKKGWCVVFRPD